jgi:hypothetical protein
MLDSVHTYLPVYVMLRSRRRGKVTLVVRAIFWIGGIMAKKIVRAKRRASKSARATKETRKARKKIEPANTYLTEAHPELTPAPRSTNPRP